MTSGSEPSGTLSGHLRAAANRARPLEAAHALESLRAKLGAAGDTIRVGRFELKAHLGTGGMGTVMAAYDPQLQRTVALKVLHPTDDAQEHARLLEEARSMAKVRHPNLVAVYEVGTHEGAVFVAMEFVEGGTLRQWLETRPRGWLEVAEAFLGAARGLGALHDAGLVHRDFKPDNVLLNEDGRAQVSDFGLALHQHHAEDAQDLQATSHSGRQDTSPNTEGTPGYLAPEQWIGARADAASDQWSFCVALYEALYGARPFRGKSAFGLRAAVLEGSRAPLTEDRPRVPSWLRKIVNRGLSGRPEARFASMHRLHDALQRGVKRHRGRYRRAALFAGLGAAGLLGVLGRPAPDPCQGLDGPIEGLLTAQRRETLAARFAEASGSSSWAVLEHLLDDRMQAWVSHRREACEATRIQGTQSEDALDLRMQCLDRRADEIEALLATYDTLPADGVERALAGFDRLPSPAVCADLPFLQRLEPLPEAPKARATAVALRRRATQLDVRLNAGEMDEAPLTNLVEDAEAAGYEPVLAEALLLQAKQAARASEGKRAADLYERTFDHALAGQHVEVQIWAASSLVHVRGSILQDDEAAKRWAGHTRALLRAHPMPKVEAALESNLGAASLRANDLVDARRHLERAAVLFEALEDTGNNELQANANLAVLARYEQRLDESARMFEAALDKARQVYGPRHPLVSRLTTSLAHTRRDQGDLDGAELLLREAARLIEEREGADAQSLGHPINALGRISMDRGRHAEALPLLDRAIAIWSAKDPEAPDLSAPFMNRGEALLELGRLAEAREALARSAALQPKTASAEDRAVLLMLRARAAAPEDPNTARALAQRAAALEVTRADVRTKLAAWRAQLPP